MPPSAPCASVAILVPLFRARLGRHRVLLDLFSAAHHRLDARREAQKCEYDKEYRNGAEKLIQPVSHAKADQETGHQFDHHPPGKLRLRIMLFLMGLGRILGPELCNSRFQLRQSLALLGIGHTTPPSECCAFAMARGGLSQAPCAPARRSCKALF